MNEDGPISLPVASWLKMENGKHILKTRIDSGAQMPADIVRGHRAQGTQ